jgi:hypothetical protein
VSDQTWGGLFPAGRHIYYEGNDPDGFCAEIKDHFGFDPSAQESWGRWIEPGFVNIDGADCWVEGFRSYGFDCPPEHLDAIYAPGRWLMGS